MNGLVQPVPTRAASVRPAIARAFGQAATAYDQHATLQREVADVLLAQRQAGARHSLLDLGCGTGYCAAQLRAVYPDAALHGLDLAPPMLRVAHGRGIDGLALVCADAARLPFADASFDLLVSSLAIQWCPDVDMLFTDLHRVLRPGAQALLSTFVPGTLRELRAAWAAADAEAHVNAFMPPRTLVAAARQAGFGVNLQRECRVRHYPSLRALARDLKGIGAQTLHAGRRGGLTTPATFRRAEQAFAGGALPGRGTPVSWELCYLDLRRD